MCGKVIFLQLATRCGTCAQEHTNSRLRRRQTRRCVCIWPWMLRYPHAWTTEREWTTTTHWPKLVPQKPEGEQRRSSEVWLLFLDDEIPFFSISVFAYNRQSFPLYLWPFPLSAPPHQSTLPLPLHSAINWPFGFILPSFLQHFYWSSPDLGWNAACFRAS